MEQVFGYIIGLGAAVMMPIIFTILGVCIGIKFSKALKSGLLVGVGFVGLSVVTALLTSSLGPALSQVVEIYGLQLKVFDMGWPAAAAVAYNTSVGAFIIPVCLGVNLLMLLTKTTRTVNIDLWNYWHFAFIGAVVYFSSDNICWDIADCDIKHSSAASVKLPVSTTVTKYLICLSSISRPSSLRNCIFYCKVLTLLSVKPLRKFFKNFSYFCYKALPCRIKACFLIIYYHIQQTKLKTNSIFNAIYKKFL